MRHTPSVLHCALLFAALAAPLGAQAQSAQARYRQDLQICDQESTPESRMQCNRDATATYDRARGLPAAAPLPPPAPRAQTLCEGCGTVAAVNEEEREGHAGALGTIAGGVIGAAIGHQIGGGFGKQLATVAGAAGGVYGGRALEERAGRHVVWVVTVEYPGGMTQNYDFPANPNFRVGQMVRRSGESVTLP
ncbi:glycine zipper 2TM domain-containing protein [Curvibacter sp. HBC61]|uniref:Glycine zipper 2TM domain-containing protein n=1 Tax=Curvibacter cyanobacteriorum TaxID=3026422 RepID=A0ABT5MXH5_9BURK|nr:glycine zipper 2TM domain-containing protein [Curvibacter sp. HBC61]MDD0837502.1 glycine zipper 2TM domain-containing protein [Curvibacter sp. HBC61]